MTDRDLEQRKKDLLARRAKLSTAQRTLLERRLQGTGQDVPTLPITRVVRDGPLPLSLAQQRLWFLDQLEPGRATYNFPLAVRLSGALDVAALEHSLNDVVRRHETLRTTFITAEDLPRQLIAPTWTLELPVIDLQDQAETEREHHLHELAQAEAGKPFDLATGPLLRAVLVRLNSHEHVLLLTLHHIVSDGWSLGVLVREMATLYQAFSASRPSPLPDLPIQYADYAAWQRQWLTGEVLEQQLEYWKRQLSGALPVLDLPTDHPRPPVQTFNGTTRYFQISKDLTDGLKALSRQQDGTLFMTLLAGFQTLLHRYTGQTDLIVGAPIANRNRAETEGLIGFFVNTLALRVDLSGDPTFVDVLERVRHVTLEAYAHQDLPFDRLVEELQLKRDLSRSPLFQVMLVLQNAPMPSLELPGLMMTGLADEGGTAKFDLTLSFTETVEGLQGFCEYNRDLFEAATIDRLVAHLQVLLAGSVAHPEERLSRLPLLTDRELQQLLAEWNTTHAAHAHERGLPQLFEEQVARTPHAIALTFENHALTYGELNRRANQLAHHLQALGVGPEVLVGICLDRSVEMVIGLLGILKAGGAYVPLDPAYPRERLAFMVEDIHAPLLLTQAQLAARLPASSARIICLDTDWEEIAQRSTENPDRRVTADNAAYIIYTSGSTGKPKGTVVPHQGLGNLAWAQIRLFDMDAASRVLQFASISFDASVSEVLTTLLAGATLCLGTLESLLPGPALIQLLRDQAITTVTFPPSVLAVLPEALLPALRTIVSAGESCSGELVARWSSHHRLINAYGPTEATVCATATECYAGQRQPPIGRPIANIEVYILDSHQYPVSIGVPGELYIGGQGVARGYLNRPELTAERFLPNPWGNTSGSRMYRTGDLVRYRPSGEIEYLGRIDHQVKVRGFRIELGEIETVLRQHPTVTEAVVVAREDQPGNKRLVAYLVPHTPDLEVRDLRQFLHDKLPDYMVPSAFVVLEALPLTPNGKVDRRALPLPEYIDSGSAVTLIAPRDVVELRLVQMWEDLLRVHPIGVRHDFFELGGHSLLAVQLMARIRQEWDCQLPVAALFQGATIEQLAVLLRQTARPRPVSSLVTMQTGEPDQLPLFLVHPGGGHVLCYTELVRHLGPDRPCYALQARGLDGEQEPDTQIETMAQHYVAALQTVQPHGPYLLGGWSSGGLVAFEMAQQLRAQAQEVALLVLLDSYVPVGNATAEDEMTPLAAFAQDLGVAWQSVQFDLEALKELDSDARLAYLLDRAQRAEVIPASVELAQIRQLFHVFQSNVEALRRYIPRAYSGQIVFYKANEPLGESPNTPETDWIKLALGGLDLRGVPGNHYTILREPNVENLAEQLKQQLRLADEIFRNYSAVTARSVVCDEAVSGADGKVR